MGAWLTMDGCPASRGALSTTYLVDNHKAKPAIQQVLWPFRAKPSSCFDAEVATDMCHSDPSARGRTKNLVAEHALLPPEIQRLLLLRMNRCTDNR